MVGAGLGGIHLHTGHTSARLPTFVPCELGAMPHQAVWAVPHTKPTLANCECAARRVRLSCAAHINKHGNCDDMLVPTLNA